MRTALLLLAALAGPARAAAPRLAALTSLIIKGRPVPASEVAWAQGELEAESSRLEEGFRAGRIDPLLLPGPSQELERRRAVVACANSQAFPEGSAKALCRLLRNEWSSAEGARGPKARPAARGADPAMTRRKEAYLWLDENFSRLNAACGGDAGCMGRLSRAYASARDAYWSGGRGKLAAPRGFIEPGAEPD